MPAVFDRRSYEKLVRVLRRQDREFTVADAVVRSALPLETVRELLPRAADEYSARLKVTGSGEILYSFPQGFTSRYRGFSARAGKFLRALGGGLVKVASFLFKAWIVLMLVGYFALFMVLALGALLLSVAGNGSGKNRSRGGGAQLTSAIFNLIIRIWFYSELTKPHDRRYSSGGAEKPRGRPLYKAVFSFVFGDGDPNALWEEQEKRALVAFIQANRGVISLPEFAMITGDSLADADGRITGLCAEFGGTPEVTEAGTLVYRFDDLLRRADTGDRSFGGFSGPLKGLAAFSSNNKKMNAGIGIINGVNLLFGGYFLFNALQTGALNWNTGITGFSYFYALVYQLLSGIFVSPPLGIITVGLGLVPLVFSVLFWLVPAVRHSRLRRYNEAVKLENFRKESYRRIWGEPAAVDPAALTASSPECRPKNLDAARDRVIKEAGALYPPEVSVNGAGGTVYSFAELGREKQALADYRAAIDPAASALGETVFDSGS